MAGGTGLVPIDLELGYSMSSAAGAESGRTGVFNVAGSNKTPWWVWAALIVALVWLWGKRK